MAARLQHLGTKSGLSLFEIDLRTALLLACLVRPPSNTPASGIVNLLGQLRY